MARAFRAMLREHAAALPMFATRNATGPRALAQVERGLAVLVTTGMSIAEALSTFQVVFAYVVGHSLYTFTPLPEGSRVDYGALPADRFVHLRRIAELEPTDSEVEFERGLDLLVEGIRRDLAR